MNKVLVLGVVVVGAFANFANASPAIPRQFHGGWASSEICKQSKDPQDTEAQISVVHIDSTNVGYGEVGCELKRVSESDASHLSGIFECQGDGVGGKEALSITLDAGRLRLVDKAGKIWQSTSALPHCN